MCKFLEEISLKVKLLGHKPSSIQGDTAQALNVLHTHQQQVHIASSSKAAMSNSSPSAHRVLWSEISYGFNLHFLITNKVDWRSSSVYVLFSHLWNAYSLLLPYFYYVVFLFQNYKNSFYILVTSSLYVLSLCSACNKLNVLILM